MEKDISWLCGCLLVLGLVIAPTGSANLENGLMLYFDFEGVAGDTVPEAGGHDGELAGGAEITPDAKTGTGAIKIGGAQDAMNVETFPALEEYQTNSLLFWINFTDPASGAWDQIMAKPAPGSDRSPGLWVTPEGLSIHYRYNPGNMGPWGITPTGNQNGEFFEEGTWYHVAGITDDGTITCYVDGVEIHSDTAPAEFAQGAGGFHVGNSPAYGGGAAKFLADDLAFYDRALTGAEVNAVMEGGLNPVESQGKLTTTWAALRK